MSKRKQNIQSEINSHINVQNELINLNNFVERVIILLNRNSYISLDPKMLRT